MDKPKDEVKPVETPNVPVEAPKSHDIVIHVFKGENGIDCKLSEDTPLPPNEIYIRGIFDKAKEHALMCFYQVKLAEAQKKPKILIPGQGNTIVNCLKAMGRNIILR